MVTAAKQVHDQCRTPQTIKAYGLPEVLEENLNYRKV